ncbi:MAG: histidine triad nucleotide-binding protein [Firmicutes bacterium]|nr:histidine triad nucleotide-binding protein [Bacillota bacterium]MCL5993311.1 histidine triad nucleotide-binding protein [Bacillota bacterium]
MENCVFCKIVKGDLPATVIFENEHVLAFKDISPLAPTHVLLIPKRHMESLDDLPESEAALAGELLLRIKDVAAKLGVTGGYKVVSNCGEAAGQLVYHLHFHILSGKKFVP